ncbi:5f90334b-61fa-433d-8dd1-733e4e3ff63c [Sclerotinia trifoliorum]|uniref:5f90334b-61fa-433d-8dd1-733e4e3ff63c n=1 Tax=Sclerotinia trifoliorum TaxID=28548 RepID=A0A8H2VLQ0_9HELO|nr:5f90334b-61fa-433d-8dd1-733e4e3ff63c [Sclerotinia trifoliorum]
MLMSMFSRSRLRLFIILGLGFADVVRGQYGAVGMENEGNALSPRYYMGLEEGRLLGRDSGVCESGSHSCLDINGTGICCSNSQYCIVSPSKGAACCAIGSNCDSPCSSDSYLCSKTTTVFSTATVTSTCCPRACPSVSLYKCADSLGGGCCNYNAQCVSSGSSAGCAVTLSSSSTTALVSIVPPGCTTNQIACASSMGGGCCDVGFGCTVLSGTNYCAATTGTLSAIRTGSNGIMATGTSNSTSTSHGLSTGAKAGIGIGVSILALASIGACIYFFTIHRRRSLQPRTTSNRDADIPPAMSQFSGSHLSHIAASKAGSKTSKLFRYTRKDSDYFSATAPSGPFTEGNIDATTSPGHRYGHANHRGVPATPQNPSDIAAPVEIGGREREMEKSESMVTTPGDGWEYVKEGKFREGITELE